MKKNTRLPFLLLSSYFLLSLASCRSGVEHPFGIIPAPPDYADTTQWYIVDRQAAVDIFYVVSTETGDYTVAGVPCHFADTYDDSIRALLLGEMQGVDQLLAGDLNFFSPYYRQCTLQTYTSDSLVSQRVPLAMGDAKEAFAYYLEHFNGGRSFILAGFSQGANAVVELVKTLDEESYGRMVAAYVVGWKVTDDDLAATPWFRPAHDSADLGVTVCYNSVRSVDCALPLLSESNRVAITPVNWRTDDTPATLVSPLSPDTLTVTLDTVSRLLLVDGYSRTDYILPLIGREGNYHCLEISLYADCLRRNMALRAGM